MKDTSFIVIETTVLYSYLQIGNVIISHSRLSASRFKNKLSALYNVINVLFLPISLCLLLLLVLLLVNSQILLGIKIFPAFVTPLDFVDFRVPD